MLRDVHRPRPRPHRPSWAPALALGIALGAASCKDETPMVAVTVCGDLQAPDDVDTLRVTVRNEDRSEAYSGLVENLAPSPRTDLSNTSSDAGIDAGDSGATPPDAAPPDAGAGDVGVPGAGCAAEGVPVRRTLRLPAPTGRGWVEVVGLRDGVRVAASEIRSAPIGDSDRAVVVPLNRDCLGAECPLGQTCRAGACVIVPQGETEAACAAACPR